MLDYVVRRPGREYRFTIWAGYAALRVWNGPAVLVHGGYLGCGSALKATPDTLKAIADNWLSQVDARGQHTTKKKRK